MVLLSDEQPDSGIKLKSGNALKQIAPAVGYQSVAAFHRVFRQRFGVSPKEWLEQATVVAA